MTTTGRSIKLVKQIGEHLVASELTRRGFMVEPFSGNVRGYDLIATDIKGNSIPIQVKTIRGGSWQFSIEKYAFITIEGKVQIVGTKKALFNPELICVFVVTSVLYGGDQFYVLKLSQVQDILIANYKRWLDLHNGIRPRNPESLHCSIYPPDLEKFRDNWSIIKTTTN